MKFLIVEQDLRVSGTSQGIISRSFLAKLRKSYPDSFIKVVYLKRHKSEDALHLLPVDEIEVHPVQVNFPLSTIWANKLYWRAFHVSLKEEYVHKAYAKFIAAIDYNIFDHIIIRSAGIEHETILAMKDLPILKKSIVNFHDPYPLYWYPGSTSALTNLELFRMKKMQEVVNQAKACMSSAYYMSRDMQYLYGQKKYFYTLPHQYNDEVFDFSEVSKVINKEKPITISYHGAIQFGRNVFNLLDAYKLMVGQNPLIMEKTEFILRVKGIDLEILKEKYRDTPNIIILKTLDFSNSAYEQKHEADINIILENGPYYSDILVGKAPFLAYIKKPVLCISPKRSEMRRIVKDDKFIADSWDKEDIKLKLESLINFKLNSDEPVYPFGEYFSDETFKEMLDQVLFSEENLGII